MTFPSHRQAGSALVIVLSLVFLLTGVLVAFLSRSILDQQIASCSASQAQTDILAKGALEIVIGDIRQEIAAGSKPDTAGVYTAGGVRIFVPSSNQTAVPFATGGVDRTAFPNVLKESFAGQSFFSGTGYLTDTFPSSNRASASVTTAASLNHRVISVAQWNAPLLMVPTSSTDASPKQTFTPPNWIIVTRSDAGVNQSGNTISSTDLPHLKDKANADFAIGRFAYVIYDEGGGLDINVAGNGLTPAQNAQRGWLHQVDLTQIPGIVPAGIPALISWRLALTGNNADTTAGSGGMFDPTRSFSSIISNGGSGDQCFLSRQDLIAYARNHSDQFSADLSALQYLSTFSREANAPSWTPEEDAGNSYSYATNAEASSSANRDLANVRVTNTDGFTRNDNTVAKVGDPLLKARFPLSRIALLNGATTPSADTLTKIKNYFGLSIKSGGGYQTVWIYNHGSASSIYTLDQVAGAKREPDFFELLKAAILAGSLARDPGPLSDQSGPCFGPASDVQALSSLPDAQIIQIGANIIDQYDSDSYPTTIYFQAISNTGYEPRNYFYGIENLPYLSRLFAINPYNPASRTFTGYIQPEVWNPHQATNVDTNTSPSNFKVVALGSVQTGIKYYTPSGSYSGANGSTVIFSNSLDPSTAVSSAQITFPKSAALYNPTVLSSTIGASSDSQNMPTHLAGVPNPVLFRSGTSPAMPTTGTLSTGAIRPSPSMSFMMEYQAADGNWYPYSTTYNIKMPSLTGTDSGYRYAYLKADPRTDRFGLSQHWHTTPGSSLRPDAGAGQEIIYFSPTNGFTWNPNQNSAHTSGFYLGLLSSNTKAAVGGNIGYYEDRDATVRPGDAIYGVSNAAGDGCPLALTTNAMESRRPVILNRPFRSVGELGYAFRDLPWKSLDLFTTSSADAALLDVFSVNDAPVMAGRVNLNTRNRAVLEAALSGGLKLEAQAASVSSVSAPASAVLSTDVSDIANAIVNWTSSAAASQGPLLNRADLVTRLATVIGSALSTTPDQANKTQREAAVRALADVSNTRTWNLMVDLVAQTGRYPTTATNLDQFLVEGQRRYWLHLAIDRYTGNIVAEQLEPVNQ